MKRIILFFLCACPVYAQAYTARTDLVNQPYPGSIPCPGSSCAGGGALLGANTIVTTTDFGNQIIRVSDDANCAVNKNGFGLDASAEVNFMNKNDDRFIIQSGGAGIIPYIWNGTTQQATAMYGCTEMGTPSVFPSWSFTQPYILYSVESSTGAHNASIFSYDFTSTVTPPSRVLVVDLTTCVAIMAGLGIPAAPNLTISHDDQTFGVTLGTNTTTANIYAITWNRTNGCSVWNTSTGAISGAYGSTGTIGISDRLWLHNGRISLDGNWLRIDIGQCTSGSCMSPSADQSNNIYYWNIATLTVNAQRFSSSPGTGGHQAMGWTKVINQGQINLNDPNSEMVIRPYANVESATDLLTGSFSACTGAPCGNHSSWANDANTDTSPVFTTNCIGKLAPNEAWDNEIIGTSTDLSGKVYRFSHTYASCGSQFFSAQFAVGSVSQSGKWFAWSSDWNGMLGNTNGVSAACSIGSTCRADVFITSLTQSGGGGGGSTGSGMEPGMTLSGGSIR